MLSALIESGGESVVICDSARVIFPQRRSLFLGRR